MGPILKGGSRLLEMILFREWTMIKMPAILGIFGFMVGVFLTFVGGYHVLPASPMLGVITLVLAWFIKLDRGSGRITTGFQRLSVITGGVSFVVFLVLIQSHASVVRVIQLEFLAGEVHGSWAGAIHLGLLAGELAVGMTLFIAWIIQGFTSQPVD